MRTFIVSILLAGVAASAVTVDASAQTRRRVARVVTTTDIGSLPLTVNRRSWLDPGPVAPRGTGQNYVTANTVLNRTQDRIFSPDGFGNDVIIGQPYVPGRSVPIVEFSSLPDGRAYVDNALGYQNYYFNPAPPELPPASPVLPTGEPYIR